jgi:hypothetical protein
MSERTVDDIRAASASVHPEVFTGGGVGWTDLERQLLRDRRQLLAALASVTAERDALRAQLAVRWQPIETAPRRVRVLVTYPITTSLGTDELTVFNATQDSLGWDTGAWRLHEDPLHWMPMPEPPELPAAPPSTTPEPRYDD